MRPLLAITLSLGCALAGCRDGIDFPVPPPPDFAFTTPEAGVLDSAPGVDQNASVDQAAPDLAQADLATADLSLADLAVAPPPAAAQLLLTAVWPAQTGDADVLELRALTAGTTQNIVLQQDSSYGAQAQAEHAAQPPGQRGRHHLGPSARGWRTPVTDETGKSLETCTDVTCRDNAWTWSAPGSGGGHRLLLARAGGDRRRRHHPRRGGVLQEHRLADDQLCRRGRAPGRHHGRVERVHAVALHRGDRASRVGQLERLEQHRGFDRQERAARSGGDCSNSAADWTVEPVAVAVAVAQPLVQLKTGHTHFTGRGSSSNLPHAF